MHFSELISISQQEEDPWSEVIIHIIWKHVLLREKLFITFEEVLRLREYQALMHFLSRSWRALPRLWVHFHQQPELIKLRNRSHRKIVLTAATFLGQATREISTFCSFSRNNYTTQYIYSGFVSGDVCLRAKRKRFDILVEQFLALTSFTQSAHHHWANVHNKPEANTLMKTKSKEVSVFRSLWTSSVRF